MWWKFDDNILVMFSIIKTPLKVRGKAQIFNRERDVKESSSEIAKMASIANWIGSAEYNFYTKLTSIDTCTFGKPGHGLVNRPSWNNCQGWKNV